MITLLLAETGMIDINLYIGYLLTGLELFFIISKVLSLFVPINTKFGKLLQIFLKGINASKTYLINYKTGEKVITKNENNEVVKKAKKTKSIKQDTDADNSKGV